MEKKRLCLSAFTLAMALVMAGCNEGAKSKEAIALSGLVKGATQVEK